MKLNIGDLVIYNKYSIWWEQQKYNNVGYVIKINKTIIIKFGNKMHHCHLNQFDNLEELERPYCTIIKAKV